MILIRQLDVDGHNVSFTNGEQKVTKRALVFAQGSKTRTFYINYRHKEPSSKKLEFVHTAM